LPADVSGDIVIARPSEQRLRGQFTETSPTSCRSLKQAPQSCEIPESGRYPLFALLPEGPAWPAPQLQAYSILRHADVLLRAGLAEWRRLADGVQLPDEIDNLQDDVTEAARTLGGAVKLVQC
jgi:hypothetical protein